MTPRQVTFNSYQLMNMSGGYGIMVTAPDHDGTQNLLTSEFHLTRGTGSVITNQDFDAKPIVITGSIIGSSVDDMENRIDTLMQNVQGISSLLAIQYNYSTRNYSATYKSLKIIRGGANVSKCDYVLTLTANSGVGYDSNTSQLNTVTFSGANPTFPLTLSGSFPRQYLILSGTLNTYSGVYNSMTFTNNTTSYSFGIQNRYWNVGDVFVIDFFNQTCLVNGQPVPFVGTFFSFSPTAMVAGTQLNYTDSFITRNITLNISYLRRWA